MKQCTKGSSGVQSQEETLYGRESLIVMAEHFKCISNTVVGTVQYWITIIWLFMFKIVKFCSRAFLGKLLAMQRLITDFGDDSGRFMENLSKANQFRTENI